MLLVFQLTCWEIKVCLYPSLSSTKFRSKNSWKTSMSNFKPNITEWHYMNCIVQFVPRRLLFISFKKFLTDVGVWDISQVNNRWMRFSNIFFWAILSACQYPVVTFLFGTVLPVNLIIKVVRITQCLIIVIE